MGNCPSGELSRWGIVLINGELSRWGIVLVGNCLSGVLSYWELSWWELSGWELGELSAGELSGGIVLFEQRCTLNLWKKKLTQRKKLTLKKAPTARLKLDGNIQHHSGIRLE